MKIINMLNATQIDMDHILGVYTGPVQGLDGNAPQEADAFEKSVPERIIPRDLVLHELNLLQVGFEFWIKVNEARSGSTVWVPARMDR